MIGLGNIKHNQGSLRFESVVFGEGPKMIEEMTAEINLLLTDEFHRRK